MATKNQEPVNFDKILNKIGNLGRYQIIQICIIWFSSMPCGMFSLANVFFAAVPNYWCSLDSNNETVSTATSLSNISDRISKDVACADTDGESGYNSSRDYPSGEGCPNWIFDTSVYGSTIITEWAFVCSKEWLASLSQTTYMCGIFVGAYVSGAIGDRFGRKLGWIIGLAIMTASGIVSSYMPNYWAYISIRIFSAIGNAVAFINGFVLIMEVIATKYRMKIGVYYQLPFAVGYMILAWIAYFIRDFRHLGLCIGLVPVLSMPFYFFIDESPRWLMTKGRFDEAYVIVKKICKTNKVEYPESMMQRETENLLEKNKLDDKSNKDKSTKSAGGPLDLIRTPKLRTRMVAICYGWILCSLTYYGLSQASSELVGGPYLNLFLSGLMEFPGILLCGWLLDVIGRKWTLAGVFFLSGICVLLVPAVLYEYPIVTTVFSMIGKMSISGGFAVIFVYTAELFPTVIRTLAVGTGSMCSRIGSITSPNIILLGSVWAGLPFIVFGGLTLLGGFVMLVLPETLNHPLLETVEEGENFGKGACQNICEFPCIRKSKEQKIELEVNTLSA